MKTTKEGIEFSDLKEFSKFITDLDLLGIIQLREALKDKKGNILIKELVYIRDSSIKKLESISDQYIPIFKVQTNSELIGKIRKKISQEVTPVINETEKSFISILFTQNVSGMKNTENLIGNSFYSYNLVLTLYEIMIGDKDFFQRPLSVNGNKRDKQFLLFRCCLAHYWRHTFLVCFKQRNAGQYI